MNNKCKDCDIIAVQHWFEAGTTFKINCNTLDAEKCYKELMERRRGYTGTCGVIPDGFIPDGDIPSGRLVRIIGSNSVLPELLGNYGILKEKAYGDKWCIEFKARVKGTGNFSHTVSENDFEIIN